MAHFPSSTSSRRLWSGVRGFAAQAGSSGCEGGKQALQTYQRLRGNASTSVLLEALKACSSSCDLATGMKIHADVKLASGRNPLPVILSNSLLNMYAKCGRMQEARQIFDAMQRRRSVVSWNSLIFGYAESGHGFTALEIFQRMREEGFEANSVTYVAALKACSCCAARGYGQGWLERGKAIHNQAAKKGLEQDLRLASTLIDMYAKCGSLTDARKVFDAMLQRSVVTWNAVIHGYAENGEGEVALELFSRLQDHQETFIRANAQTYVAALKACSSCAEGKGSSVGMNRRWLETGRAIHFQAAEDGHEGDLMLANALVNMYAKCGSLEEARKVFEAIPRRSVSSWNAMIFGYADNDEGEIALQLFARMQSEEEGLTPNALSYVAALKSCASSAAKADDDGVKAQWLSKGFLLHKQAAAAGHEINVKVACSLIDMYSKCGSLADAFRVFDRMIDPDVVSWNAILMGCAQSGDPKLSLQLFSRMQEEKSLIPDARTFGAALKACAILSSTEQGHQINGKLVKTDCLKQVKAIHAQLARGRSDDFAANSLLDAYLKCGSLVDAQRFFQQEMICPDAVSWNTMIQGSAEDGEADVALQYFWRMQESGTAADELTLVAVLKACAALGALDTGKRIYGEFCEVANFRTDTVVVQTSLLDFYSKCGSVAEAEEVFDAMVTKDLVSWNALISGFAHRGDARRVFDLFEAMIKADVEANGVTFLCVFSVCSHAGLVERGKEFFELMCSSERYRNRITPAIEHYSCMVDLLSRANHLDEAVAMLRRMPYEPNATIWRTVLSAARKWKNVEIGKLAFDALIRLEDTDCSAYVLMANTYTAAAAAEEEEGILEGYKKLI